MFHFSGYWQTWSRVLSENHPQGPFVEVNLTPIPCSYIHAYTWKKEIAPIRIRAHCTPRYYGALGGNKRAYVLPENVKLEMIQNLGKEITERLLTEDFLSQIDWDLYRKVCNGGANFENIRRR